MKKRVRIRSILISFLLLASSIQLLSADNRAAAADTGAPSITFSAEERAYLARAGEITVGCPVNSCPVLFQDEKTGQIKGVTIDILDMIAESTGLTFRYLPLPSGSVTYQILQQLEIDMVAGAESNGFNRNSLGIVLTEPYLHAAKVFVCKKGTEFRPDGAMTIAVSSGSQTLEKVIRQQYPLFQVLFYNSTEEALAALLTGKADAVLQNQYTVERILRKPVYGDLQIVATAAIGDSQCLAHIVPISEDRHNLVSDDVLLLQSILNKGIKNLNQSRVSFLVIKGTSENAYRFTVGDLLYLYRYSTVVLFISLVLILVLLHKNRILHQKRTEQIAAQRRAAELAAINAQMEEQQLLLMDALKNAEEGSRAKTTFLFNMSHDIRTPMNAILGFTEIGLHNIGNTAKVTDCLEKIQASGKHLLQLINNVLDMSKIESGKVALTEDRCDLTECVEKVRDILQPEISQKRLSLQTDLSGVKNPWVYCDGLRFHQILFNLLSNAVKFSRPGGHVLVALQQQPCAMQEYAAYQLRVKDDGIGMSPEFLSRIFEPFEREHTSTVSQIQGTGLGMSITKNLVDLMGGAIRVSSEPDRGTEFVLQFTFKVQEPLAPAAVVETAVTRHFSGKRLLLVEDNALNMEIIQDLVREVGFLTETAVNGQIAVEMVRNSPAGYYDAILMDIQMPVMDGYQAAHEIRGLENKALAGIPIIALTANAFDEDKKKALANGMNAHIAKPLNSAMLYQTLAGVLKENPV